MGEDYFLLTLKTVANYPVLRAGNVLHLVLEILQRLVKVVAHKEEVLARAEPSLLQRWLPGLRLGF